MDEHEEFCKAADERATKAEAEVERLHGVCRDLSKRNGETIERWAKTADDEREAKEAAIKQRDEAYAKLDETVLQNDALKKYYDWSMDAGSWSDVGLDAKDGTRWIISVEEAKEMERLMTNVDSLLNPSTYGAQQPEKTNPLKRVCEHKWAHIEDHHVICEKCKHTADLCWTCESEKTKTRDGGLTCLKCQPQ